MTAEAAIAPRSPLRFWIGVAAYVLPTFPLGYAWHLVVFADAYEALKIFREDVIIPFGLASMIVQAVVFSYAYPRLFPDRGARWVAPGLCYGAGLALIAWTFSTLAVAAKHQMTSVPDFMALETGFTIVQFAVVGPLIALAHRN